MTTGATLPEFDPLAQRGPIYRFMCVLIRTRLGRRTAISFSSPVDRALLRISCGRLSTGLVLPTASLTTTGARSGRERRSGVLYFTDDGDAILVASNFGRDRHPAWYHNLKAHPAAVLQRGGRSVACAAYEITAQDERERLFGLADEVYGGYSDYRARAAAVGRRIPIIRLRPLR